MMRDLARSSKGLQQQLTKRFDAMLPRQATVIRSEGIQVWVAFDGSEHRYLSLLANTPVGTVGWVFAMRGGKGFFIPRGIVVPVPFSGYRKNSVNTTSISSFAFAPSEGGTIALPAGTYRANGMGSAMTMRTVASANAIAVVRIGGVQGESMQVNSSLIGGVANRPVPVGLPIHDLEFTTDGSGVTIEFGVRGHTDAGTTYLSWAACAGTFTRIG